VVPLLPRRSSLAPRRFELCVSEVHDEQGAHFLALKWLADEPIHSRSKALLAIFVERRRRHCHDRCSTVRFLKLSNRASCVRAVHIRHVEVH